MANLVFGCFKTPRFIPIDKDTYIDLYEND